jgi:hypothetical protein
VISISAEHFGQRIDSIPVLDINDILWLKSKRGQNIFAGCFHPPAGKRS